MKEVYVEKRIENSTAYIAADLIEAIFNEMSWDCLSRETRQKFNAFLESMQKDIGCLECDDICGRYIVEYGYNYK